VLFETIFAGHLYQEAHFLHQAGYFLLESLTLPAGMGKAVNPFGHTHEQVKFVFLKVLLSKPDTVLVYLRGDSIIPDAANFYITADFRHPPRLISFPTLPAYANLPAAPSELRQAGASAGKPPSFILCLALNNPPLL
jgi:hypothetical protein